MRTLEEELKELREELEVYKKALEFVKRVSVEDRTVCPSLILGDRRKCIHNCDKCMRDYEPVFIPLILQKAREEE